MNGRTLLDGATALVITADREVTALVRSRLERAGVTVLEARDGAAGLELARRLPDLVIADIRLPDMDGLTLTAALKSDPLTQQIPVIQRSSVPFDERTRADWLASGADAYLVAPISEELLLATATSLIRHRELTRQLETALSLDVTGVFDWAVPTGRMRWSESLELIHGMAPGGFGGSFDDFVATVHADDRSRVVAELEGSLASGSAVEIAYRFIRTDGSQGWMEARGRVFRSPSGEPVRLLGLAHDVTSRMVDRQRAEQLARLASEFNAARASKRVLEVLRRELIDTGIRAELASPADPPPVGAMFSTTVGDRRLDLFGEGSGSPSITTEQLDAISDLAVGALDRALRYEVERSNAIALQRALLPTSTPEVPGWSIDARYIPATTENRLGGDFYDIVQLGDRFVVVLGDVAGHGLDAASQMGMVRTLLRTMVASHDGDPAEVLGRARSLFATVCGEESPFVTAIVATFDRRADEVRLASAGHPPPVVHCSGRTTLIEIEPGPPLGIETGTDTATVLRLAGGDWVGFFSDGVFESRRRPIDEAVAACVAGLGEEITATRFIEAGESEEDLNTDDRAAVVVQRKR